MHIQVSQVRILASTKCPTYTHDDAKAKFGTNWDETDYSDGFFGVYSMNKTWG